MSHTTSSGLDFTVRRMAAGDIPSLATLLHELEAQEPGGASVASVSELATQYQQENEQGHIHVMAGLASDGGEGALIAHGILYKPIADEPFWIKLRTLPQYRRHGVGNEVYHQLEAAARAAGAREMHTSADQHDSASRSFFASQGFIVDHERWLLRLPAEVSVPAPELPHGYAFRDLVPGEDEDALRQICLAAFEGYPDFFASDVAEQLEAARQPDFRPGSIFFVVADDAVAGYCLLGLPSDGDAGWIGVMGVAAPYRRTGLGRAMLLKGIHYLRQLAPVVKLGTEGYNHRALALYEGVGFERYEGQVELVKRL